MKVSEILKKNEVTISCEIFPPKQGAQLQNYKAIAAEIAKLKPAYISCTYGATGGTSDYTVEIADAINSYGVPAIAHLTCVSSTREKVHTVIHELKERGIENILALRGDIPTNTDFPLPDQYHHAIELIREIREAGDFCIGGACYPEGHPESKNIVADIENLKRKADAGASQLVTQLFLDNDYFYSFLYIGKCFFYSSSYFSVLFIHYRKKFSRTHLIQILCFRISFFGHKIFKHIVSLSILYY